MTPCVVSHSAWSSCLCSVVSVAPGFRSSWLTPIPVGMSFPGELGSACAACSFLWPCSSDFLPYVWDYTHSALHAGVKARLCNAPSSEEWKVNPLLGNTMTLPVNISILWHPQLCTPISSYYTSIMCFWWCWPGQIELLMRILFRNLALLAEDAQKGRLVRDRSDSGSQASRWHGYNDFLGYQNVYQVDAWLLKLEAQRENV